MMALYAEQTNGENTCETTIAVFTNKYVQNNTEGLVNMMAKMREKATDTEFRLGPYYSDDKIDEPLEDIWNTFLGVMKLPSEPLTPGNAPK